MRLSHVELDTVFTEKDINILCFEDTEAFRDMCLEMQEQFAGADGKFVLSEGDKTLSPGRYGLFISDLLGIDINEKKAINRLYAELNSLVEEKYQQELTAIIGDFTRLLDKLNCESAVELDWNDRAPVADILKSFGVTYKKSDTFFGRLYDFLSAVIKLFDIRFLCFVNLKSFLKKEECYELYKLIRYNGVLALSLESFALPPYEGEKNVIIDGDLCEIIAKSR